MILRLRIMPFAATALLLSTLGCSKKDDSVASPGGTGSYKLDGNTITCQPKAYTNTTTSGGLSFDYLEIDLTTTPQPASGAETLKLYFYKQTGQPNNAYTLTDISFFTKGSMSPYYFANDVTTLSSGGNSFSGTFSAKAINPVGSTTPGPYIAITNGVFTDARP